MLYTEAYVPLREHLREHLRRGRGSPERRPDLAGIFGANIFSIQGAAIGVRQAGKQGAVKLVGFDAGPTQVKDLREKLVDALIAQHPSDIGRIGVQMAVDYLKS